jgi:hypothetical protein
MGDGARVGRGEDGWREHDLASRFVRVLFATVALSVAFPLAPLDPIFVISIVAPVALFAELTAVLLETRSLFTSTALLLAISSTLVSNSMGEDESVLSAPTRKPLLVLVNIFEART